MATGKTIALTRQIFVGNVMSLLLNTLSGFVVAFLPVSKHLLFSWLLPPSAMFLEPTKIKSVTVSAVSASICHDWWDRMPWSSFFECWVLSQLFYCPLSSSSRGSLVPLPLLLLRWCHLHVWGYWYFSRQSWFQLILHPALHFAWCTLHIS